MHVHTSETVRLRTHEARSMHVSIHMRCICPGAHSCEGACHRGCGSACTCTAAYRSAHAHVQEGGCENARIKELVHVHARAKERVHAHECAAAARGLFLNLVRLSIARLARCAVHVEHVCGLAWLGFVSTPSNWMGTRAAIQPDGVGLASEAMRQFLASCWKLEALTAALPRPRTHACVCRSQTRNTASRLRSRSASRLQSSWKGGAARGSSGSSTAMPSMTW
eukprot:296200-Chlamydomonas_euryale.AAC.2